jgi:signal transduction histidine kinase
VVKAEPSRGEQEPHKRVLMLYSLGPSFAPFDEFASGFQRELSRRSPTPVEFFEASLESARFEESTAEGPFVEYLSALFRDHPLDLVVSIGGAAGRFCIRHRKDLLSSTPFLTTGLERRVLDARVMPARAAVVSVVLDLPAQVENILRVLPNTTDIVIVTGTAGLGRFWIDEVEREFQPLAGRVRFTWFHELSLEKIEERVSTLPANTAIFYGGLTVDDAGIPHERDEALDVLRAASSAPIFGLFDTELGRGIVGGPLLPIDEASRRASEAALRILGGEAPEKVVIPPVTVGAPSYDFRELARWHIAERLLPPGSTILFRPTSAWEQYRVPILAGLAVIGLQAALIAGLLVQHSRRRAAEKQARSLTRRLITAHEDERRRLARELHDDLSQRLARLAIDAAQMEPRPGVEPGAGAARSMRDDLVRLGEDVHSLSYRLHPSLIEDLGLKEALQTECDRFSRSESIETKLDSGDVPETLPPDVSLCLFRVAQEALNNVARHARASRASLSLSPVNGGVRLVVSDDGVGFDPSRRRSHASLGHASMKERVTLVDGKLQIESVPGRGTTVSVWVPAKGSAP